MCVFCKIVNGQIPSYKVYEDPLFIGILDISQATYGHTLLISKNHFQDFFDLGAAELAQLGTALNVLAQRIKVALGINNLNIINNSGSLAGQTVNHFHIHLLPRYLSDDLLVSFPQTKLTEQEFRNIQTKILAQS